MSIRKEEIINKYYLDNYSEMIAFCFSICRNIQMAEDLIQNIFLKLLIKNNFSEIRNLESYVFRCIRWNTYTHLKKIKKHNQILDLILLEDKSYSKNENNYDFLKEKIIEDCIKKLPKRRGKVFVLKRIEHKSIKEISKELSISEKTVENHITHALKDLKTTLAYIRYV